MKRYEAAAARLRREGPMTIAELARRMEWPHHKAVHALLRARYHLLVVCVGKQPSGRLIFGAVQTIADRL